MLCEPVLPESRCLLDVCVTGEVGALTPLDTLIAKCERLGFIFVHLICHLQAD